MRNMLMVGAASFALFGATQAMAVDTTMNGAVPEVCEISGLDNFLQFSSMTSGQTVSDNDLIIQCNDADGATVELRSAEGGMEADDDEDFALTYDATLSAPGVVGLPLVLNAPGGPGLNDVFVTSDVDGSLDLANGVTAAIEVELTETAVFSGGYSDTLSIEITAN